MTAEFIVNHLWQSSCFALLASVLAFMLRGNSPKVRYWVWLSASLKFLVPWVLLVSLGNLIPWPRHELPSITTSILPDTLVQIAEPFSPNPYAAVQMQAQNHWSVTALVFLWTAGFIAIAFKRCRSWYGIRAMLRAGLPMKLPIAVPALITPSTTEPAVVGFLRPVLVLPRLLLETLNPKELDALLAHELSHIRRRDNFFAALHMGVEAIFWFHPLVWWIGSRMLEERELACDEDVLRLGYEPTDYVRAILTVCQHYSEALPPCVSGVAGADIKKRLKTILRGRLARELNGRNKLALGIAAAAVIVVPVGLGVWDAPTVQAQQSAAAVRPQFEVASIRRSTNCDVTANIYGSVLSASPGRLDLNCATTAGLILGAYSRYANGHTSFSLTPPIGGGPSWINSDRYTINAKAEGYENRALMNGPMLQVLLEDRFKLRLHRQTQQVSVFTLIVTKSGAKLKPFQQGTCVPVDYAQNPPPPAPGQPPYCQNNFRGKGANMRTMHMPAATLQTFSELLGAAVGRPVIDRTGIKGIFDLDLEFAVDENTPGFVPDSTPANPVEGVSIFTAVQEQLGLKLEPGKGPGEVLVIDHVERPSED